METIKEQVEALVTAIKESSEYQSFQEAEKQVANVPGLDEQIREYCWESYEIQNGEAEGLEDRIEEFEGKYKNFRNQPVVSQYLESELRMCRMLQAVHARITDVVELMI